MRQVQKAFESTGIRVYADVWRADSEHTNPPAQYAVYTTSAAFVHAYDDAPQVLRTHVYLNLWSQTDPTGAAKAIRSAMLKSGFGMLEERTGTESTGRYNEAMKLFCVNWTFVLDEELTPDADGT